MFPNQIIVQQQRLITMSVVIVPIENFWLMYICYITTLYIGISYQLLIVGLNLLVISEFMELNLIVKNLCITVVVIWQYMYLQRVDHLK